MTGPIQHSIGFKIFNLTRKIVQNENHFVDSEGNVHQLLNGNLCECKDKMLVLLPTGYLYHNSSENVFVGDVILVVVTEKPRDFREILIFERCFVTHVDALNAYKQYKNVYFYNIGNYFIDSSYQLDKNEELIRHSIGLN